MTLGLRRWRAAIGGGLIAFALCSGAAAEPGAGPWHETERGKVRLIAATATVGQSGEVMVGVEMRPRPGWKTYWRHPGEAGLPPRFDWSRSRNIAGHVVLWPTPERFMISGMESVGYSARVIFPIRLSLERRGSPAEIKLHFAYAFCREICVPEEATLALTLPAGAGARTAHAAEIANFAARAPRPGGAYGWHIDYVGHEVERRDGRPTATRLMVTLSSGAAPFESPELLVVGEPGEHYGKAALRVIDKGRRVHFVLPHRRAPADAEGADDSGREKEREIILTVIDGKRAGEFVYRIGGVRH